MSTSGNKEDKEWVVVNKFHQDARTILKEANEKLAHFNYAVTKASWAVALDPSETNIKLANDISVEVAKKYRNLVQRLDEIPIRKLKVYDLKRQLKMLKNLEYNVLPDEIFREFNTILERMGKISRSAENPQNMPHSGPKTFSINDWKSQRSRFGMKTKSTYAEYVRLNNIAAKMYGFSDAGIWRLSEFNDDDEDDINSFHDIPTKKAQEFLKEIDSLWTEIQPLYKQLHAYVRNRMRLIYVEPGIVDDGMIPSHLVDNNWSKVAEYTMPYPNEPFPDVTGALNKKGYKPVDIFREAEKFFLSLGFSPVPRKYWEKSILEKKPDSKGDCQRGSWNFFSGDDFRTKQCTRVMKEDFLITYREMAHIQYFMQYNDQPAVYRQGANPGFHAAIAGTAMLSASTRHYWTVIDLIRDPLIPNFKYDINDLYIKALSIVAQIPLALMVDHWRRDVFSGRVKPENYNCHWWNLAHRYQGVEPPIERSEKNFDAASVYHVMANVDYTKFLVATIHQFQIQEALCLAIGQYDPRNIQMRPLHACDIYNNSRAGALLRSGMHLGSSRPWPDVLERISGQTSIDTSGILAYFKPLYDWLVKENERTREHIGWSVKHAPKCHS